MLKNKFNQKLVTFGLLINSATLLVPNKFKIYPIIFLMLSSSIFYIKSPVKKLFSFNKIGLISCLIFIYLISYFYSFNTKNAFFRISTMASLLAFAVIFELIHASNYKLNQSQTRKIFITFILCTSLFCLSSFIYFWNQEYNFSETIIHYSNVISFRIGLLSIHSIYLSIFIGISVLTSIHLLLNTKRNVFKLMYFINLIFLLIMLSILMRKGPIISLTIALIVYLINQIRLKAFLFYFLITILTISFSISFLPKYKNINRFEELFNDSYQKSMESSSSIRYRIYKCSIQKIADKPFFGYGVGNTQSKLDLCYIENKMDLSKKTYNCHNQYFSVALTAGIVGLLLYLLSVLKIYKKLIEKKNIIGYSILTFFLLNFFTENVIERENGMLLYSFFLCLFLYEEQSIQ